MLLWWIPEEGDGDDHPGGYLEDGVDRVVGAHRLSDHDVARLRVREEEADRLDDVRLRVEVGEAAPRFLGVRVVPDDEREGGV